MKLGVSDPQVVRVDDLIAHAKEIIETLKLAAVEFEYDGIGYSVDSSGRVLQRCDSSVWTVLREEGGKPPAIGVTDPRDEALRVATDALENIQRRAEPLGIDRGDTTAYLIGVRLAPGANPAAGGGR